MKYCIPGELWNQIVIPERDTELTSVSTYVSEMVYKITAVTDLMLTKELWHTVCDFSERCGALRERISGYIDNSTKHIDISSLSCGSFQRFIGAGVNGSPCGLDKVETSVVDGVPRLTFDFECQSGSTPCYVDVTEVPLLNADPSKQKVPLWFLKRYNRALVSGTLMRIYAMSGEAWQDDSAARMHATTYLREINKCSYGLITSGMRKDMLVDAESVLARQSTTSTTNSTTNTVG